jgi:hypothetical protein
MGKGNSSRASLMYMLEWRLNVFLYIARPKSSCHPAQQVEFNCFVFQHESNRVCFDSINNSENIGSHQSFTQGTRVRYLQVAVRGTGDCRVEAAAPSSVAVAAAAAVEIARVAASATRDPSWVELVVGHFHSRADHTDRMGPDWGICAAFLAAEAAEHLAAPTVVIAKESSALALGLAGDRRVAAVADRRPARSVSSAEARGLAEANRIAEAVSSASCLGSDRTDRFAAADSGRVDALDAACRGAAHEGLPDGDDISAGVDAWASDGPEYAAGEVADRASDGHASADDRTSASADDAADAARDRLSLRDRRGLQGPSGACDAGQAARFAGEDPGWGRGGSLDRASSHLAVRRRCCRCSAATLCSCRRADLAQRSAVFVRRSAASVPRLAAAAAAAAGSHSPSSSDYSHFACVPALLLTAVVVMP